MAKSCRTTSPEVARDRLVAVTRERVPLSLIQPRRVGPQRSSSPSTSLVPSMLVGFA
jgi:hypothetical protein